MVGYRPARASDAAGLARVHTCSWQQAYRGLMPADFLARRVVDPGVWVARLAGLPEHSAVWVAEEEDEVVGFSLVGSAQQGPGSHTPRHGQLYALYVLSHHWGHGVGHRLHEEGVRELVEAGFTTAVLWVLETNTRAIAFYQRHGWVDEHTTTEEDVGGFVAREKRFGVDLAQRSSGR